MKVQQDDIKQVILFHGSPDRANKRAFGCAGNVTPEITPGRPFFLTDDYHYAESFARGGVVSELDVSLCRVLDLHDSSEQSRLLQIFNNDSEILQARGAWDEDVDGDISESSYFLLESPDVMKALIGEGFNAVLLPEDIELGVESYALLSPESARLRLVHELSTEQVEPRFQSPRMG